MYLRPPKTHTSLGIHQVWSEYSLGAQWVAKAPSFLYADSEDSDQTGRMLRLIWVFTWRTCYFIGFCHDITKTYLYNFDPLKPHFYIVKLGFTGVYIILLISVQNIDCGYSLEPPRWGGSNGYPQFMFWAEIWKISEFLSENYQFLVMIFSIYLNRFVFVMRWPI